MLTVLSRIPAPLARPATAALLVLPLVVAGGTAFAQMQQPPAPAAQPEQSQGPSQQLLKEITAKRAEIEELGVQLQEIQQETMEANPELAEQRDELVTLMDTRMVEAGHDPDASRDRIEVLQGQLQGQELSQTERQQLGAELRQEMTTMQQAQGQAMQDEEVQTQRQSLNEDLVSAMEEQDPQTGKLISDLQSAQREYRQLAAQAQRQQGGGGASMQPRSN